MSTVGYYSGKPNIGPEFDSANYAKARAKQEINVLYKDFLSDLPDYIRDVMWRVNDQWGKEEWFEKAWNEYRDYVLECVKNGDMPKGPGHVFNKYISDAIDQDFLEAEQKNIFHSDLSIEKMNNVYYGEANAFEFIKHGELDASTKKLKMGQDAVIRILLSTEGNIDTSKFIESVKKE